MMQKIRNHKKISITILVVLAILLVISIAFGRYIYNMINNYILETKGFYFNSSVLAVNSKNYNIRNWDGVNSYTLNIDLNNRKNSLITTREDIQYEIQVICSNNVSCTSSKQNSVIYKYIYFLLFGKKPRNKFYLHLLHNLLIQHNHSKFGNHHNI